MFAWGRITLTMYTAAKQAKKALVVRKISSSVPSTRSTPFFFFLLFLRRRLGASSFWLERERRPSRLG